MTMSYPGSVQKIQFKSFAIKALSKATAPGAVSDFTVTPGAEGAATATLQFKAPQVDAEGNELTGTVDVKIYREDETEPCHTESGLAPEQREAGPIRRHIPARPGIWSAP